jgi:hypothetical protein
MRSVPYSSKSESRLGLVVNLGHQVQFAKADRWLTFYTGGSYEIILLVQPEAGDTCPMWSGGIDLRSFIRQDMDHAVMCPEGLAVSI